VGGQLAQQQQRPRPHGAATAGRCAHDEELHQHVEDEDDVDAAVGDEEAVSPSISGDVHEAHLHGRHDGCEDERNRGDDVPIGHQLTGARIEEILRSL
jgi:hypothetical protein